MMLSVLKNWKCHSCFSRRGYNFREETKGHKAAWLSVFPAADLPGPTASQRRSQGKANASKLNKVDLSFSKLQRASLAADFIITVNCDKQS